MDWIGFIAGAKELFMVAFAIYVIQSVAKNIWKFKSTKISIRERFGALGFSSSAISAAMFLLFYVYAWFGHKLIAHGETLFLYYDAGEALAWIGLILGFFGLREIRKSAILISIVMIFQWYGRMVGGTEANAIITFAMLATLTVSGCLLWLTKNLSKRRVACT